MYFGTPDDLIPVGNSFNIVVTGSDDDQIVGGNGSASKFFSDGVDIQGNAVKAEDRIIHFGNRVLAGTGKDTLTFGNGYVDLLTYFEVADSSGANTNIVNGFQANFAAGQIERSKPVDGVMTATLADVIGRGTVNLAFIQFGQSASSYSGEKCLKTPCPAA